MIAEEEVLAYLEHYGVKGQRWGVRRNRVTGTAPTKTARRIAKVNTARRKAATGRKRVREATKQAAAKPRGERTKREQQLVVQRRINRGLTAMELVGATLLIAKGVGDVRSGVGGLRTDAASNRARSARRQAASTARGVEYIGNINYARMPIRELMPGR